MLLTINDNDNDQGVGGWGSPQVIILIREEEKAYPFIIFDKENGEFAGSTRFYNFETQHKNVTIGYTWIGKNFQKTGLNPNMKFLMLQYAFETLGAERVEFRADARNANSINAMQRLGCTIEGTFRQHLYTSKGERRSSVVLSILKDEWISDEKNNLLNRIQSTY